MNWKKARSAFLLLDTLSTRAFLPMETWGKPGRSVAAFTLLNSYPC